MNFEIVLLNQLELQLFISNETFHYIDQSHNWRYLNIIMDNQVLRAINHIKYVNKKKPSTLKKFNYLQNNEASN